MLKHLYLLLFSTFLIGFLSGAFVYFITRGPIEPQGPELLPGDEFEVIVDTYGGCSRPGTCDSYRIREGGEYIYIDRSSGMSDRRVEGELTRLQVSELRRLIERTDLEGVEDSESRKECPALTDGIAYRIEITVGERYLLDSCVEDLVGEQLFDTLIEYFDTFGEGTDKL